MPFKCGTAKVEMRPEAIVRVVNASSLDCAQRDRVEKNEVAEVILRLDRPAAFDTADSGCDATSRFVVVDGYEIAGAGSSPRPWRRRITTGGTSAGRPRP